MVCLDVAITELTVPDALIIVGAAWGVFAIAWSFRFVIRYIAK